MGGGGGANPSVGLGRGLYFTKRSGTVFVGGRCVFCVVSDELVFGFCEREVEDWERGEGRLRAEGCVSAEGCVRGEERLGEEVAIEAGRPEMCV
jgi:hypothetical protein